MMKGLSIQSLVVIAVAVILGATLLYTSQATQDADQVLASLKSNIQGEKEAIRLLDAEWAYLNSPQRLEKLAAEYYGVSTPTASQMIDGTNGVDLPFPVPINSDTHELMHPVAYGGKAAQ